MRHSVDERSVVNRVKIALLKKMHFPVRYQFERGIFSIKPTWKTEIWQITEALLDTKPTTVVPKT